MANVNLCSNFIIPGICGRCRNARELSRNATRKIRILSTHWHTLLKNKRSLSTSVQHSNTETFQDKTVSSTIDENEVKRFNKLAKDFWRENGDLRALHTLNHLRVPFIRDVLKKKIDSGKIPKASPLKGVTILDVGCGAGILSEPLSRLGASVTGIDAAAENIKAAEAHRNYDPALQHNLQYMNCTTDELIETKHNHFDCVVASEVVEHVADPLLFVKSCSQLAKPGGSLVFTTLNKTTASYVLGVFAAERVLKLVPKDTHDWNKFIDPLDLKHMLEKNDCMTRLIHGIFYNFVTNKWTWVKDTSINYILHAEKVGTRNSDTSI